MRAASVLPAALAALAACRPADETVLFLGRSPAARSGAVSWAPDPDSGRLIVFDARLHAVRVVTSERLGVPMAVASLGGGRLLVSDLTGDGLVFDTAGRFVREWPGPFAVTLYAARDGRVLAGRSPYRVPQFRAESAAAPLFIALDTVGRPLERLGAIRVPQPALLAQVANAGPIALGPDGAIYYAPLVRDAIQRYDPGGALRWTARRDVPPLPIVNVALAVGPPDDRRLYALGAADSGARRLRLDVFDVATGRRLESWALDSSATGIAVDRRGRLRFFDARPALAALAPAPREPFGPAFALPTAAGDTARLGDFLGRVTLVNFWASWCDPCREEFPHMAHLWRELPRADFAIAAISDDVDRARMTAFVREFQPPFPVLVGGGRMKAAYHYRGLPYSVLLDRQGRVVQRIFGFGGAAEFARLRETIAKEIAAR